ncbi:unnamed protein product, partial [marine sediment metagenome]
MSDTFEPKELHDKDSVGLAAGLLLFAPGFSEPHKLSDPQNWTVAAMSEMRLPGSMIILRT